MSKEVFEWPFLDDDGCFQSIKIYNQYDSDKYFAQEKPRWKNGFGNLTGRHYFHLTWGNIINEEGRNIRPLWCDGDAKMFDAFDWCSKNQYDMAVFKRRRAHFTTWCGTNIIYNCIVYPNSTSIFTSCDTDRIKLMRVKALAPMIKSCMPLLMTDAEDSYIWNDSYTQFAKKGSMEKEGSFIAYPETSKDPKSPTKVQGYAAILGIVDEMLIHPRVKAVRKAINASLNKGLSRIPLTGEDGLPDGYHSVFVQGGSCDNIDKLGSQRAKEILTAANGGAKIKIVEIPGWMSLPEFMDESGFSKQEEATKYIYKHRQELVDAQDWDGLADYIMNYYITIDEVVSNVSKKVLGDVVMHRLKESYLSLINKDDCTQCTFARNGSNVETIFTQNVHGKPEGNFFYRKLAVPGHVYGAGRDPIPYNTTNPEGSHDVTVIKDFTADEDVAYLDIRETDFEKVQGMWETLLLAYKSEVFTNGAPCMMERNRGEAVMQWCEKNKKVHLLAPDPKHPEKARSMKAADRGNFKTESGTLNNLLYAAIRRNGLQFLSMHDDFNKFGAVSEDDNIKSDLLDAKSEAELFYDYVEGKMRPKNTKSMPRRVLTTDAAGQTTYKYETVDPEDED